MKRQYILVLCSLFALSLSLIATAITHDDLSQASIGYQIATETLDLPIRVQRMGVNADLTQYDAERLEYHLNLMEQTGIHWVRQFIYWDEIETVQGEYDWSQWDTITNAIEQRESLELVVVIMNTPEWYRREGLTQTAPPDDLEAYQAFLSAFAIRYGDIVDTYQIWDEPNLDDAWGNQAISPADYTNLLSIGASTLKASDSNAMIITGALAPTNENNARNLNEFDYLRQLYALEAQEYWDAIGAKPYGFDSPVHIQNADDDVFHFQRIERLREVMLDHDDGQSALWASNWGWNSLDDDWQGESSIWGQVSKEQQIQFTQDAITYANDNWAWLGGLIYYHWKPNAEANDPLWGYSVIDQQDQPTPLLDVLTNQQDESIAKMGHHNAQSPAIAYSGVWTVSDFGADIGWLETSDSQLEFTFEGTDIALIAREGDYFAFLYSTIDGQPANALPRDNAGNAYVFLRSATLEPTERLIPIATGLSDGVHTLRMVADKGWDQWAIKGFAVSDGNALSELQAQRDIGIITIVLSTIAVIGFSIQARLHLQFNKLVQRISILSFAIRIALSFGASLIIMFSMVLTFDSLLPNILRRDAVIGSLGVLLSGGLVAIQPPFIITLIGLFALFVLLYQAYYIGILLVVFWLPFYLFPIELFRFAFPIYELVLLLTVATGSLRGLVSIAKVIKNDKWELTNDLKALRKQWQVIDSLMVAYIILSLLSVTWSLYRSFAITDLRVMVIEPVLLYLLIRVHGTQLANQSHDKLKEWLWWLVGVISVSGVLVAGFSLMQFIFGTNIITAEAGAIRLGGIYGSPNGVALYLERVLPFALCGAWLLKGRLRIASLVASLIMLSVLLMTLSVGAILLALPAIALVLVWNFAKRYAPMLTGLGGILLIAIIIIAPNLSPRFANLLNWSEGTDFIRIRVWESSFDLISDYPITGIGHDQFLYWYRAEYVRPDAIFDPDLSHPHNIFLDAWVRMGIGGLIVISGLLAILILKLRRYLQSHEQHSYPIFRLFGVGVLASMSAMLAHGMIDNALFARDLFILFIVSIGYITAIENIWAIDAEHKE